jgi:hypothetical protein
MSKTSASDYSEFEIQPPERADHLDSPSARHLAASPDVSFRKIRVRIGNRPLVTDLKRLSTGLRIPEAVRKDFEELRLNHELWVVRYAVGIISEDNERPVNMLGLQVDYGSDDQSVVIVDLLPQTKFIKHMNVGLACDAAIGFNGQLALPATNIEVAHVPMEVSGEVKIAPKASALAKVTFSVITSEISAIGVASNYGEWQLQKRDTPLVGDQYFYHVLMLDGRTSKVTAKAAVRVAVGGFFRLPVALKSKPVPLTFAPA